MKETEYLKLLRWKADGFPPINLNNMVTSVTSLMRVAASLEEENKRLTNLNKQLYQDAVRDTEYIRLEEENKRLSKQLEEKHAYLKHMIDLNVCNMAWDTNGQEWKDRHHVKEGETFEEWFKRWMVVESKEQVRKQLEEKDKEIAELKSALKASVKFINP